MLSDEVIKEYIDIYKNEFGIILSRSEATKQATRLLEFFKILLKVDKKNSELGCGVWQVHLFL